MAGIQVPGVERRAAGYFGYTQGWVASEVPRG